ncbi:protein of unknown function [Methylorubrum extorquens]|uniref:Uncharacterized protein n=1 Tax=Methylorubrum extorquens TaxID=408 RepID=A0A2N9AJ03_METEX|nr:protein of unknown function [Methylorubrum extorquens]
MQGLMHRRPHQSGVKGVVGIKSAFSTGMAARERLTGYSSGAFTVCSDRHPPEPLNPHPCLLPDLPTCRRWMRFAA